MIDEYIRRNEEERKEISTKIRDIENLFARIRDIDYIDYIHERDKISESLEFYNKNKHIYDDYINLVYFLDYKRDNGYENKTKLLEKIIKRERDNIKLYNLLYYEYTNMMEEIKSSSINIDYLIENSDFNSIFKAYHTFNRIKKNLDYAYLIIKEYKRESFFGSLVTIAKELIDQTKNTLKDRIDENPQPIKRLIIKGCYILTIK